MHNKSPNTTVSRCMGSEADLLNYDDNELGKSIVSKLVKEFPNMDDPDSTDGEAVEAHCKVLLLKMGCRYGGSGGIAAKYPTRIRSLLENGLFTKKNFKMSNEGMADKIAMKLAIAHKDAGKGGKTPARKFALEFMSAFRKYCEVLVLESEGKIKIDELSSED